MTRILKFSLKVVFLFLVSSILVRAQVDRGTINGTVSDSTGAVVPGVVVTATNVDTGESTTVITNTRGIYSILNQPVGRYLLKIDKPGFKQFERKGITLSVLQVAEIDVTLEVGSSTQVVNVTDNAPVLDTETSNVGSDIKTSITTDLPLNVSGGRDVENFAFSVMPGVEESGSNGAKSPYAATINGTQNFTKDVQIDGTSLTATITGDQQENGPPMEAVQELNVQTSGLSADNANTPGGVEFFTLKSGTNTFHGSAFGYGHNEILDANTWSNDNQGIRKAESRFWDYGFSAGGPIIKNRTFVFGAFERYQQNSLTPGSLSITVPTNAFLTGDFSALLNTSVVLGTDGAGNTIYSGAIFDPTTGNVFPGNVIQSGRFSAVAKKIIQEYQQSYKPATNALSDNEYSLATATPTQTTNEMSIRADHTLTNKNHLSGSFIYHKTPRLLANYAAAWAPGTSDGGPLSDSRTELVTGHSYRVSDSYTVRANMLNVASLTYNRYWNGNVQIDSGDWPSTLGFGDTGWHNFPAIPLARHGMVSQSRTLETAGPTTTSARPTSSTTRSRGCLVVTPSRLEVNSGCSRSAALQEPERFTLASIQVRPARRLRLMRPRLVSGLPVSCSGTFRRHHPMWGFHCMAAVTRALSSLKMTSESTTS